MCSRHHDCAVERGHIDDAESHFLQGLQDGHDVEIEKICELPDELFEFLRPLDSVQPNKKARTLEKVNY